MGRIRFANQLRGVAALSVACSHLIGVFWALPEVVSQVTATPPQEGTVPALFWLVGHTWFNPGPFGVALFFLISGLVVPFSLETHGTASFLLARVIRIFPTYIAALLIEVAAISLAAFAWGRPLPFTPGIVAGNLALIYDLIGQPSVDLVNWTLSVELKFYLAIVVLAPLIRRGSALAVVLACVGLFGANQLMVWGVVGDLSQPPSSLSYTFSSHSLCLMYMFIGTLFHLHIRKTLSGAGLVVGVSVLALLFAVTWRTGVWGYQFPIVPVNYAYAAVLFGLLYGVRDHVPKNVVLDAVAAISFPFYLVHSLMGYLALKVAMVGLRLPYYPALAISLAGVTLLAWVLHRWIERPTQRLGRSLGAVRRRHDTALVSEPSAR